MVLNLESNGTLRMAGARGTTVKVLDGRVWITEAGRQLDAFLARGANYSVSGDGVVVIGAEARARLDLRREPRGWIARWLRARRAERELQELSDHSLRDIGLRRDQIYSILRR
jgi:uncharacterized protein YjiS (DUF1127 family)